MSDNNTNAEKDPLEGANVEYITSNDKIKNESFTGVPDAILLSPAIGKAVENDTLLSDDESRTLTTLETVKKTEAPSTSMKKPLILNDVLIKKAFVLEKNKPAMNDLTEIAKKQLESLKDRRLKSFKPKETTLKTVEKVKNNSEKIVIQVMDGSGEPTWQLPCSVLGRNTENPGEDIVGHGRNAPKPRPGVKLPSTNITSKIFSKEELQKQMLDKFVKKTDTSLVITKIQNRPMNTPQKSKINHVESSGTIEIPPDLIFSNELGSPMQLPINLNRPQLQSHDLIAILEGDDVDITEETTELEVTVHKDGDQHGEILEEIEISIINHEDEDTLKKEREREIAFKQILSLPLKPKGRKPRVRPTPTPEPVVAALQSPVQSDLVSSLVSDWDDNEVPKESLDNRDESDQLLQLSGNKVVIQIEEMNLAKLENITKMAKHEVPEAPAKRSRIIKKKIIWDPDNPETTVSFATLANLNKPKNTKKKPPQEQKAVVKIEPKVIIKTEPKMVTKNEPKVLNKIEPKVLNKTEPKVLKKAEPKVLNKTVNANGPALVKKPKITELDRLLADEGAINMIYDLERENNNKDILITENEEETEEEILLSKAKMIKNVVMKRSRSPANPTTSRVRAKRDTTPHNVEPVILNTLNNNRKTPPAITRKRKSTLPSEDWDYVYSTQKTCDDSMIIRRRSNSSYSSTASLRRMSMDHSGDSPGTLSGKKIKTEGFEFIKPSNKKSPKNDIKLDASLVANMKGKLSKVLNKAAGNEIKHLDSDEETLANIAGDKNKKMKVADKKTIDLTNSTAVPKKKSNESIEETKNTDTTTSSDTTPATEETEYEEIKVERSQNYAQIILKPIEKKLKNFFTIKMMNEVRTALQELKADPACKVLLITSAGDSFCNGLDFSTLLQSNGEKRKVAAAELGVSLRNFLHALAIFNKPILCGVHGNVSGLGVTVLPLFDVVFAHENATFSTPYAKIGQLPEGFSVITASNKLKPNAISDLFYLCKTVTSTTALDYGLVTNVLSTKTYQDELLANASTVASLSVQALKSIKGSLKQDFLAKFDQHLNSEQKKLIQQWTTVECQEKFKQYFIKEEW